MKTVRFHPEAEVEMIDAAVWYESQQATLGKRFVTTVQDALNRIELNPRNSGYIISNSSNKMHWIKRCFLSCVIAERGNHTIAEEVLHTGWTQWSGKNNIRK